MQRNSGFGERKRQRTRTLLQAEALGLFLVRGYRETTLADIAEATDVSSRTISRYFESKEQLVLDGLVGSELVDAIRDAPPELGAVAAVRAALADLYGHPDEPTRQRFRLIVETPVLRNGLHNTFGPTVEFIAEALAERRHCRPDDRVVRTVAGAVVGIGSAAVVSIIAHGSAEIGDCLAETDLGLAQLGSWVDD